MFGGKVPLRAALVKPGEKPYLIARVGINRQVLLEAAAAGSCVKSGSGGVISLPPTVVRFSLSQLGIQRVRRVAAELQSGSATGSSLAKSCR
jgi:hypothetical protein